MKRQNPHHPQGVNGLLVGVSLENQHLTTHSSVAHNGEQQAGYAIESGVGINYHPAIDEMAEKELTKEIAELERLIAGWDIAKD